MIAVPRPDGGVTVHGSLQCPYYVHAAMKRALGLDAEHCVVVQEDTGGAFGGKEEFPSGLAIHAAMLALAVGRPVRLIYDRHEDISVTTKRHPAVVTHRAGVTARRAAGRPGHRHHVRRRRLRDALVGGALARRRSIRRARTPARTCGSARARCRPTRRPRAPSAALALPRRSSPRRCTSTGSPRPSASRRRSSGRAGPTSSATRRRRSRCCATAFRPGRRSQRRSQTADFEAPPDGRSRRLAAWIARPGGRAARPGSGSPWAGTGPASPAAVRSTWPASRRWSSRRTGASASSPTRPRWARGCGPCSPRSWRTGSASRSRTSMSCARTPRSSPTAARPSPRGPRWWSAASWPGRPTGSRPRSRSAPRAVRGGLRRRRPDPRRPPLRRAVHRLPGHHLGRRDVRRRRLPGVLLGCRHGRGRGGPRHRRGGRQARRLRGRLRHGDQPPDGRGPGGGRARSRRSATPPSRR